MKIRLCSLITIFLLAVLAACASPPKSDPVATTYPENKTTKVKNIVNVPIPISANVSASLTGGSGNKLTNERIDYSPGSPSLQTDYTKTIIGDSAEKEYWIIPRNSNESNEDKLMARLNEGGKQACGDDFRLKDTRYYYGTEGTLKFLGIKTPALMAVYRCRAQRVDLDDPDARAVEKHASIFKDHDYYDISSFIILQSPKSVVVAAQSIIEDRKLKIIQKTTSSLTHTIIASGTLPGMGGTVPEHLVLIIRGVKDGSKVTLMQMRYQPTSHERGVNAAGTSRPGFSRDAQPFARDVAFDYSRMLARQISDLAGEYE